MANHLNLVELLFSNPVLFWIGKGLQVKLVTTRLASNVVTNLVLNGSPLINLIKCSMRS